ncbi:MAG: DUF998 domain-containing protein [Solirubrobacteraceae bacterium]
MSIHRGARGTGASLAARRQTVCGVVAGPVFISVFTVLGARRAGYDWRRHAVSSLAAGRDGWVQRANFMLVGCLYCIAARGLARGPRRVVGSALVPALTVGAGVGLIGSGLFVTDPVAGFPPAEDAANGAVVVPTLGGQLHNLCAIPIFIGIPAAALLSAGSAARRREHRWAGYCAGSAVAMAGTCALFGAAFGGAPQVARHGGVLQRISIATGMGWLTALASRALHAAAER